MTEVRFKSTFERCGVAAIGPNAASLDHGGDHWTALTAVFSVLFSICPVSPMSPMRYLYVSQGDRLQPEPTPGRDSVTPKNETDWTDWTHWTALCFQWVVAALHWTGHRTPLDRAAKSLKTKAGPPGAGCHRGDHDARFLSDRRIFES